MLKITVPERELWDEQKQEFIKTPKQELVLEHSLVSLSKWETIWQKPFITKEQKTIEETISYVKCMTITQNVNPIVFYCLTEENINAVNEYIESPMTATWFSDKGNRRSRSREQVTSELIYYWMIALNIPFECQKWHLNRLLTLIEVCNRKNSPKKKQSLNEIVTNQARLNKLRRKQLNSKG